MALIGALSQWFEKVHGRRPHADEVRFSTLDNPGWRVRIRAPGSPPDEEIQREISAEEDVWIDARIRDGHFDGAAGPDMLGDLLAVFFERVANQPLQDSVFEKDALAQVREWYSSRCNGDWEHDGGVTIRSTDEGWQIALDLYDYYWPEPDYQAPVGAQLIKRDDEIRISGTIEQIEAFARSLWPIRGQGPRR